MLHSFLRTVVALSFMSIASAVTAEESDHLATKGGIEILHAWTNATSGDHARVYMEISSEAEGDVVLIGGESAMAADVHMIGLTYGADGAIEREIEQFPIKAGSEIDLTPDGLFLELHGLTQALAEGDDFELHLFFEPIGEIEVHVEVEAAGAVEHSHAGHNH
ncbi:MAG: copper chaperone PCu(A)C [Pseudomonadota bacterium]